MTTREQIVQAKERSLAGEPLSRADLIALLDIPPEAEETDLLGEAAREAASRICGDRSYLWGALGVDFAPCEMNCDFCSMGADWGLADGRWELSPDEIFSRVAAYAVCGARWIVLRTTQFYSIDTLAALIRRIRAEIPGDYELGLNTGDFGCEKADWLARQGVQFVYHALRLREGRDTRFDPAARLGTLRAVQASPMTLVSLTEPVGVEHTSAEIADGLLTALSFGARVTGVMMRAPVRGTPLGGLPPLAERRLAQIAAVSRLAGGWKSPDICVHTPSLLAMRWGANVAVVEQGAIPRDGKPSEQAWNRFDCAAAKSWFAQAGYCTCPSAGAGREKRNERSGAAARFRDICDRNGQTVT